MNGLTILIYMCVHVCVHMFAFLEDFFFISDLIPNFKKTLKSGLTYNDIMYQRCWILVQNSSYNNNNDDDYYLLSAYYVIGTVVSSLNVILTIVF